MRTYVRRYVLYRRHHTGDAMSTLFFHECLLFLRRTRYDLFDSDVRTRVNGKLHEEGVKMEKTTFALLLAATPSKAMENSRRITAFEPDYRLRHTRSVDQSATIKLIYSLYLHHVTPDYTTDI